MERVEIQVVLSGMNRVRADLAGATSGADGFAAGIKRIAMNAASVAFGNIISTAVLSGFNALRDAALGAANAIKDIAVFSHDTAVEMEQAVANIASIMGKTVADIEPLERLIRDLGIDPHLKVTAQEAAAAIEMLAKNGVSMEDILGGAARSTILLANALSADFSLAADTVTDVMAVFSMQGNETANAVNQIIGVLQNSKFDLNDYRLALARGGGAAEGFGLSLLDMNAAILETSSRFASGMTAGTGLRYMLQRLAPEANTAAWDKFREWGLIMEDGTNRFYDAAGNLRPLQHIVELIEQTFQHATDLQKAEDFPVMWGQSAMATVMGFTNSGWDYIANAHRDIMAADAELAAQTRMDTLAGKYEIFNGILEGLAWTIGKPFTQAIKGAMNPINELAERFLLDFIDPLMEYATPIITEQLIPALYNLAKAVLGVFGIDISEGAIEDFFALDNVSKNIEMVIGWLQTGIDFINDTADRINGGEIEIGWGGIFGGEGALLPFMGAFTDLIATLMGANADTPLGRIANAISDVIAAFATFQPQAMESFAGIIEKILGFWEENGDEYIDVWITHFETLSKLLSGLVTDVGPKVLSILDKLVELFLRLQEALIPTANVMADLMGDGVNPLTGAIGNFLDSVDKLLGGILLVLDGLEKLQDGDWQGAFESITQGTEDLSFGILEVLTLGLLPLQEWSNGFKTFILDVLASWTTTLAGLGISMAIEIGKLVVAIITAFSEAWSTHKDEFIYVATGGAVRDQLNGFVDRVLEWMGVDPAKFRSAWKEIYNEATDVFSTFAGQMQEDASALKTEIDTAFTGITTTITTEVEKFVVGGIERTEKFWGFIGETIVKSYNAIATGLVELDGKVGLSSTIMGWRQQILDWQWGIVTSIAEWGVEMLVALANWSNDIKAFFADKVAEFVQIGSDMIGGLVDGLRRGAGEALWEATRIVGNIVTAVRKRLDSRSPSQVFAEIGKDIQAGLALGMRQFESMPLLQIQQSVEQMVGSAMPLTQGNAATVTNNTVNTGVTIHNVNIYSGMDAAAMEGQMSRILANSLGN